MATILLVEDDEMVRRLSERVLSSAGFQVLAARSATEALELFEACHDTVDLVLTDVVLPDLSGRDLTERLRRVAPRVRVLFMSGFNEDAIVRYGGRHHRPSREAFHSAHTVVSRPPCS